MMENIIRTFQVLGLTTSLVLSGINFGSSHLVLPILYTRHSSISTPIFREFYLRGAVSLVPLGVISASCSAIAAYLLPSQRNLWAIAGAATISQVPWTLFVMMPTNNRLCEIAVSNTEQEKAGPKAVVELLEQWAWMNAARGALALVGGLAGVYALLEGQR